MDKLKRIEELEREIERLKIEIKNEEVVFRPTDNDAVWHILDDGTLGYTFFNTQDDGMNNRLKYGNIYQTEREAQLESDFRKLCQEIRMYADDRSYLLKNSEIKTPNIIKYYVDFIHDNIIQCNWWGISNSIEPTLIGLTFFKTEEQVEEIIKVFGDRILKYYNEKFK